MFSFGRICYCAVLVIATLPSLGAAQGPVGTKHATLITVFESSEELHESLAPKPELRFNAVRLPDLTIHVKDSVKYQQIDGFGASLTDSSAWLLAHRLTDDQRKELLVELFHPTRGIGLSILRQPMGASDFALSEYSYDDLAPGAKDPELRKFSIAHDRAYLIPILREALAINPNLKIIATPWSPPGWMKTSDSLVQGALLTSAYAPLARYFVKYVESYEEAGIPIYAVTIQNEPLNVPNDYPGMGMTAVEQTSFLRDYLGPAFREAAVKAKILVFDHNWDLIDYPTEVLSDPVAAGFAAGTAVHCYGGSVTAQSELHSRFPEKGIWLTECSGGEWQKGNVLEQEVRLIIDATRNRARSVVFWNLALDQNHQPHLGGCTTCRGVVTIISAISPAQFTPTVDFTALAHASKFVVPGAYRIESNTFGQGSLEDVAFQNPDGSIVMVVLNSSDAALAFNIGWGDKYASYTLEGGAVATFRWSPFSREELERR
ncbi:MAG: glucosylceramidase [Acidobacteriia bacterium]|nr:glucosylceramidase [Terriglobia bacterium]